MRSVACDRSFTLGTLTYPFCCRCRLKCPHASSPISSQTISCLHRFDIVNFMRFSMCFVSCHLGIQLGFVLSCLTHTHQRLAEFIHVPISCIQKHQSISKFVGINGLTFCSFNQDVQLDFQLRHNVTINGIVLFQNGSIQQKKD